MTGRRSVKQRLSAGERLLGVLVRLPAETLVEMAGMAGFDYLIIDCEHGPSDLVALQHHLSAAEAVGMDTLVRVSGGDPEFVQRCLDLGVGGVVVPHVESAADAAAACAHAHYPPLGQRGFATYTRAGRYGLAAPEDHLRAAQERTLVVAMVETAAGVANARAICSTEGVDAVLVGPADLSVSMGYEGRTGEPPVQDALRTVHTEALRNGRTVMAIVGDTERAQQAVTDGAGLVVYNLTLALTRIFHTLAQVPR